MNPLEASIIVALWVVLSSLAILVLILYRQLEKAYLLQQRPSDTGLPAGVEAPDIQVITGRESGLLEFPRADSFALLAFMTTSCPACARLIPQLADGSAGIPAIALVSGEGFREYADLRTPNFRAHWLVNLADAEHLYRISVVPTVYVLRGRTVLSRTIDGSPDGIAAALADAQAAVDGDSGHVAAEIRSDSAILASERI